jgi:hypothetical protein
LIKKIIKKLFLAKEIISKEGVLHFRRWRIIECLLFNIYIHKIYVKDNDLHDHPWNYFSLILSGSYIEKTKDKKLIPLLFCDYFNPVVDNWTEEDQEIEIEKRKTCDQILYVITPKMKVVYSIAEVVYDSIMRPESTIFCFLNIDGKEEFDKDQIKSLQMVNKWYLIMVQMYLIRYMILQII